MKGDAKKLLQYMEGSTKRFVIPVYQRNYDWKIENCKQLFDDLERVMKNNRKSHFFGSIVAAQDEDGGLSEHLIIDGQQRLTTVSLLLLVMYHLLGQGAKESNDPQLKDKIFEEYLVDKWQPKEKRIKLKPIKDDQKAYNSLYSDTAENIKDSTLTANYEYFRDRVLNTSISMDDLYKAIQRLEIIDISLNKDDDPQLIFESLNSTGLDLSEGDKIRNYILMGLPKNKQEDYYEKYWNPIEINSDYQVDSFIRDYLSMKKLRIPNIGRVYVAFKEYLEEKQIADIEPVLEDLRKHSVRYRTLIKANDPQNEMEWYIFRLNKLETNVARPFFLEVLRLLDEGKITQSDATEIFAVVENYIFRRIICDVPTNALNKIFVTLHNDVMRYDGTAENYLEKMKYALSAKRESGRFPSDEEFAECLANKNIYGMRSKNRKYYFERIENFGILETKDVWNHLDNGTYSIEHIMPQSLSDRWRKDLSQDGDPDEIHEIWINKAANLTLTAYNSNYSNSPFADKRDMDKGFNKSGLRMNKWISDQERWGVSQLEERNAALVAQALEIWEYPDTEYMPAKKQDDFITLDDDAEMKGLDISKYSFRGVEQAVGSWVDMYQQVLLALHSENKAILRKIAYSTAQEAPFTHFSSSPTGFSTCRKIDDDVYVWTGNNTEVKVNMLRQLFPLFGETESDLVFYIRKTDDDSSENVADRYKLRKEFWAHVIPSLRETFGPAGPFSNVNPSKDNWISGFLGISGVTINCVVRYDSARVEYYICKSNEQETKAIFDKLYSQKSEIEREYGRPLVWDRGDDKKSSKIYTVLENTSLTNPNDWDTIRDFMVSNAKAMHKCVHSRMENA